jgi:hypothetical protein
MSAAELARQLGVPKPKTNLSSSICVNCSPKAKEEESGDELAGPCGTFGRERVAAGHLAS